LPNNDYYYLLYWNALDYVVAITKISLSDPDQQEIKVLGDRPSNLQHHSRQRIYNTFELTKALECYKEWKTKYIAGSKRARRLDKDEKIILIQRAKIQFENGFSYQEIADKLNVSKTTISNWLNNS
jgi:hypothetical protein